MRDATLLGLRLTLGATWPQWRPEAVRRLGRARPGGIHRQLRQDRARAGPADGDARGDLRATAQRRPPGWLFGSCGGAFWGWCRRASETTARRRRRSPVPHTMAVGMVSSAGPANPLGPLALVHPPPGLAVGRACRYARLSIQQSKD
jgi:hypothetical protein